MDSSLDEGQKRLLLDIARQAVVARVGQQSYTPPECEDPRLHLPQGCFVTIQKNGRLRGCIGNFVTENPLYREVAAMAQAAAVQDPRFYPMEVEELNDFSLEISVLSPLRKTETVDEIRVGEHGIYLEKGFARGVLLPQVATDHNWNRQTFLEQTALKAGLDKSEWESPETDIYCFSAEIFGDAAR